jgi:uncharacterized protein (DUF302 family)
MKKELIFGIGGLAIGVVLAFFILFQSAPSMMMQEDESKYNFKKTTEIFEKEVKAAKWKVAGMHDMQEVLKGFGHDILSVKIYELCSSKHSVKILKADDERIVTPLMPCRVAIYEKSDGKTYVTRMNSGLLAKPFGGIINEVMLQASVETEVIIDKIIK